MAGERRARSHDRSARSERWRRDVKERAAGAGGRTGSGSWLAPRSAPPGPTLWGKSVNFSLRQEAQREHVLPPYRGAESLKDLAPICFLAPLEGSRVQEGEEGRGRARRGRARPLSSAAPFILEAEGGAAQRQRVPRASSVPFRRRFANICLCAGLVIKMLSEPGIPQQSFSRNEAQRFNVLSSCTKHAAPLRDKHGQSPAPQVREKDNKRQAARPSPETAAGFWAAVFRKNGIPAFVFPDPVTARPEPRRRCKTEGLRALGAHPRLTTCPGSPSPAAPPPPPSRGHRHGAARGVPSPGAEQDHEELLPPCPPAPQPLLF